MSRYSLNLRPIYGADEEPGTVTAARGIGSALQQYLARSEANRQERNAVAARGGVPIDDPNNSVSGRFGAFKRRVRGIFGQDDPTFTPPPVGDTNAAISRGIQPTGSFVTDTGTRGSAGWNERLPTVTGTQGSNPVARPRIAASMEEAMRGTADDNTPIGAGTPRGALPQMEQGAQRAISASTRRGIASAIQPYTYETASGDKYQIDPVHEERVKDALKSEHEEQQIQALVDAGMPEATARAKVLNNVVRYDETFGQRYGRGAGGLTFEQRKSLQDASIAARRALADMQARGRESTAEYRQKLIELRETDQRLREDAAADRAANADVTNETKIAGQYGAQQPKGIAAMTQTPEQKAASDRAGREQGKHLGAAVSAQQRRVNARAPREAVAARARALQQAGTPRAEIAAKLRAEGYRVTP
jgi:hypothetical protein